MPKLPRLTAIDAEAVLAEIPISKWALPHPAHAVKAVSGEYLSTVYARHVEDVRVG